MNGLYTGGSELNFLRWRKQDVDFQLNEYLPFLLSKLNTKYSEVSKFEIIELPEGQDLEGFNYKNLKMLNIHLKTIGGEQEIGVKLPVPSQDDIFEINRNNYILVSHYTDDIYYIFSGTLHSISFRIFENGTWIPFKGSQVKNQKSISMLEVGYSLGILENWFKEYHMLKINEELPKGDYLVYESEKKKFVYKLADKYANIDRDELNHTLKLFINSTDHFKAKSFDAINTEDIMKKLNEQNPFEFTFHYEFSEGHDDLKTLYLDMLNAYENPDYHRFEEIHLDFKKIRYYQQVLDPIASKIKNIRTIFNKAKNLSNDISWKQKIPANCSTKFLRKYKYMQYLELNPFIEVDVKHKIVTPLTNVPKHMRSTAYSGTGNICPLNSPDSKNIGIVQNLTCDVLLDPYGKFQNTRFII